MDLSEEHSAKCARPNSKPRDPSSLLLPPQMCVCVRACTCICIKLKRKRGTMKAEGEF